MKTESGSITTSAPTRRSPAVSHVQAVEESRRSSGLRPSSSTKIATVQRNEMPVAAVAITPAPKLVIRSPTSAITTTATAGANRAVQARTSTLAPERGKGVDVQLDALAGDRDDQPQAEHGLRGGDDHDGEG